jgi:cob(I)alamin adenosyltransferase
VAVHLTRIYTKTGDDGTTALGDMSRVRKTDPRVGAYADVDETNASLGVAIALGALPDRLTAVLRTVQNDLFDVGADLCTPVRPDPEYPPLRVEDGYVTRLEGWCD